MAQNARRFSTLLTDSDANIEERRSLHVDNSAGKFRMVHFDVPTSFDGREVWKGYLNPVRNQGFCGACWAFASTCVLESRLAIATRGRVKVRLSPAQMVLCNLGANEYQIASSMLQAGHPYDYNEHGTEDTMRGIEREAVSGVGCAGATLLNAMQYLYSFGVPEESCVTYDNRMDDDIDLEDQNPNMKTCADLLSDTYDICPATKMPMRSHMASDYYYVPGVPATVTGAVEQKKSDNEDSNVNVNTDADANTGTDTAGTTNAKNVIASTAVGTGFGGSEETIRREIYHWGPVATGFEVYDDFMAWDGKGVYSHTKNAAEEPSLGGHAVVIVGWGVSDSVPYWIVRNSWGPEWGEGGYFRIRRGTNECKIEQNVMACFPSLYGHRLFVELPLVYSENSSMLRGVWGVNDAGYKVTTMEELLAGRLSLPIDQIQHHQYDPAWWPDLSRYVAGRPLETVFPLAVRSKWQGLKNDMSSRKGLVICGSIGLAVVGGFAVFMMITRLRRKHIVRM